MELLVRSDCRDAVIRFCCRDVGRTRRRPIRSPFVQHPSGPRGVGARTIRGRCRSGVGRQGSRTLSRLASFAAHWASSTSSAFPAQQRDGPARSRRGRKANRTLRNGSSSKAKQEIRRRLSEYMRPDRRLTGAVRFDEFKSTVSISDEGAVSLLILGNPRRRAFVEWAVPKRPCLARISHSSRRHRRSRIQMRRALSRTFQRSASSCTISSCGALGARALLLVFSRLRPGAISVEKPCEGA